MLNYILLIIECFIVNAKQIKTQQKNKYFKILIAVLFKQVIWFKCNRCPWKSLKIGASCCI